MEMITTSEIKISALVSRDQATAALSTVHGVFELHREPADAAAPQKKYEIDRSQQDEADIVARLGSVDMEELFLEDISMDQKQARVTIAGVPDTPGIAASVFEQVAAADIFVDMIVQSSGIDGLANLSFTVPRNKLATSLKVAEKLKQQFAFGNVTGSPEIVKLSVSGIGLRSHTGVAIRMFKALADDGINVGMISTSEVRVNVVVDGNHGEKASNAWNRPLPTCCGSWVLSNMNHVHSSHWPLPKAFPKLAENTVHVWRIQLTNHGDYAPFLPRLVADEVARANRFLFEKHRERFVIGRASLRSILRGTSTANRGKSNLLTRIWANRASRSPVGRKSSSSTSVTPTNSVCWRSLENGKLESIWNAFAPCGIC